MGEERQVQTESIYLNPNSKFPTSDNACHNPQISTLSSLKTALKNTTLIVSSTPNTKARVINIWSGGQDMVLNMTNGCLGKTLETMKC